MWLETYTEAMQRCATKAELAGLLDEAVARAAREGAALAEPRLSEVAARLARLRAGLDAVGKAGEARAAAVDSRLVQISEHCTALEAARREGDADALAGREVAAGLAARLCVVEATLSALPARGELDAELARKLDVRTFLASNSASAAAASASALLASPRRAVQAASPLRQQRWAGLGPPPLTAQLGAF